MEKIKTFFQIAAILGTAQKDIAEKAVSQEMRSALELWQKIAHNASPWLKHDVHPCGVLQQLSLRLSTLVSREIGLNVENDAIASVMKKLNKNVGEIVEYMTLYGSCLLRPIFSNGRMQFELIPQGQYIPISFDLDKTLTGAYITKHFIDSGKNYVLLEEHSFANRTHKVKNTLFRNFDGFYSRVSLSSAVQTQGLNEAYEWQGVDFPMIVEFRSPKTNLVDDSDCAVPLYAGAENLIKDADEQYSRMIWEQEAKTARVFIDRDLLAKRQLRNGDTVETHISPELKKLFMQVEGDGSADTKSITIYSPEIRTSAQNEAFQQILRRIELTLAVGKGTLSDMESTIQTATQYSGGRAELFAIVDKLEDEIEAKYERSAEVFAHIASSYGIGANNAKIGIEWNEDSTRKDMTSAKNLAITEIQNNILAPYEYRMQFFGETEVEAKERAPEATERSTSFNFE